jgi:hypothetical protein
MHIDEKGIIKNISIQESKEWANAGLFINIPGYKGDKYKIYTDGSGLTPLQTIVMRLTVLELNRRESQKKKSEEMQRMSLPVLNRQGL